MNSEQTKGADVPGCWGTAEYTADIVTAAIGEGVHTSPEFTRNLEGGKMDHSSQTMRTWLPKTKTQTSDKLLCTHYLEDTKKKVSKTILPSISLFLSCLIMATLEAVSSVQFLGLLTIAIPPSTSVSSRKMGINNSKH